MKIIRLEILNLASLDRQGGEVINFEEGALGDSTIFSIVGPTGSGKSTLLDAICLALYGRAPRYPRKAGERRGIEIYGEKGEGERNRPAPTDCVNILTRGRKVGYSKLTFKANNGNVYRAEWHVKFNRVNYDRPVTRLYLLTKENGQPKEEEAHWEDIPAIIGLDYEQFLRTVLIAQGSFADFLTAKEDERYQLLEKLIGCEELYTTIAAKIKEQKDNAVTDYNLVATNVSSYQKDLIPDEELEAFEDHLRRLEEEEKHEKAELAKVVESLGWYTAEEQFLKNLKNYESALSQRQQDLEAMKTDTELLKLHDATLPAVGYYRFIRKAKQAIDNHDQQLKNLEVKLKEKQSEITEANKTLATLKESATNASKTLDDQKPHINKARTIKGELVNARKSLKEKEEARKDADDSCKKAKKDVCDNAQAITAAEQALKEAETTLGTLMSTIDKEVKKKEAAANDARNAFATEEAKVQGQDAEKLQKADRDANRQKTDIAEAIKTRKGISENTEIIRKTEKEILQITKRNEEIDNEVLHFNTDALTKEIETLQKSYTLMTSENWAHHRMGLDEGQPCPLCGATHHPYTSNEAFAPVVSEMDALINEKRSLLENLTTKSQQLSGEKSRNMGSIEEKGKLIDRLKSDCSGQQQTWAAIHSRYPDWPEDISLLTEMQQRIDDEALKTSQALTNYHTLVKAINSLRKQKDEAEDTLRKYKEESEEKLREAERRKTNADTLLQTEKGKTANLLAQEQQKTQALDAAIQLLSTAQADVTAKEDAIKAEIGDKDPDTFEETLSKSKLEADEAVKDQDREIGKLEKEQEGLQGQVSATEKTQKDEEKQLSKNESLLETWLSHYNASPDHPQTLTIDDIAGISESDDDWESIRQELARLTAAVTAAKTTYDNEKKDHDDHQAKKPAFDQPSLMARKTVLEQQSNDELVACQTRKKRHDDAKKHLGTLHKEVQQKTLLKKEWEEIANAIGSDGKTLRKIAQCYTLRFLIAHANDEIRKFNSRYELQQVKNSLGIRVIDHDRADDVRDTTSLSGGETFIVSLGLALGLSALSSRNISFENLFIDEGFGTLDHDSLETVISSLAMLQSSQGKKVGIISHTDSMSRITTQIRVIRNGSSGSSHIEIYP